VGPKQITTKLNQTFNILLDIDMQVLLITDQHFGVRNDSLIYVEYYKKFYTNVVIPFIRKHKIKHVVCLGDTFDRRKSINFNSLEAAKEMWFQPLADMGVQMTMLVGNHDIYYKNTLRVNAPSLLLGEYANIQIIDSPTEFVLGDLSVLGIPWICDETRSRTYELLEKSVSPVCMGHLEFNGFEAHPGHVMEHGIDGEPFKKFQKVFSGHYHSKSNKGNIHYLGNPYELYWNDYQSRRGFHVFDTETLETKFYRNPYTMFEKIFYEEKTQYLDVSYASGKYVKVIVQEKQDQLKFDRLIKMLYDAGVADLKIIEDLSVQFEGTSDDVETEDTLTLLEKYIDEVECSISRDSIKNVVKTLYLEACEV
jgi:DNA repair exonuclease SbcCD nuclease subunit